MRPKKWIDIAVMLVTAWVVVGLISDQRFTWPYKVRISHRLQQSEVHDLAEFLAFLSSKNDDLFPPLLRNLPAETVPAPELLKIESLERLVVSGNAPERLLSDPTNRRWLEVSGLATPIETLHGLLWVGRVSGYHGPITVFAMDGKILEVAWTSRDAMTFWASRDWIQSEVYK